MSNTPNNETQKHATPTPDAKNYKEMYYMTQQLHI